MYITSSFSHLSEELKDEEQTEQDLQNHAVKNISIKQFEQNNYFLYIKKKECKCLTKSTIMSQIYTRQAVLYEHIKFKPL